MHRDRRLRACHCHEVERCTVQTMAEISSVQHMLLLRVDWLLALEESFTQ